MSTDRDQGQDDQDLRDAYGVPAALKFEPGLGRTDINSYRCTECGAAIHGTEVALEHPCVPDDPCPACGSKAARPDIATDGGVAPGRVDECERCGTVFRQGGDD